jgi:hypothetical protein
MSSKPVEHNGQPEETAVVKSVTPNDRILYDARSILQSEAARRHFDALERLAERGLIRKPAPSK